MNDLFDKAVGFSIKVSRYGNRRKVDAREVEVDANKDRLSVSKMLLKSKELEAVTKYDNEFKAWLKKRALPSMFRSGIWLIPLDLVPEVDARFESYRAIRASLVAGFVKVYERCLEESREELGSLFNEADYPNPDSMSKHFDEEAHYVEFKTPKSLGSIRAGMFERQNAKLHAKFDSALEGIRALLRAEAQELVARAADRLSPTADGKRKTLHETVLTNIEEFIGTFKSRNICDDKELDAVVSDIRALSEGLDINRLRSEDSIRDAAAAGFAKLLSKVDELAKDAPVRALGD